MAKGAASVKERRVDECAPPLFPLIPIGKGKGENRLLRERERERTHTDPSQKRNKKGEI